MIPDWISLDRTTGINNTVTIICDTNQELYPRKATIDIISDNSEKKKHNNYSI